MIGVIFVMALAGLGLFCLENLLAASQVHLRPLALLVFYLGLDEDLTPAFVLAVFFGLLQDSYALTPFGLHLVGGLFVVAAARFCRRHFQLRAALPQMLAGLVVLVLQDVVVRFTLVLLGARQGIADDMAYSLILEIVGTTLLAPLILALLVGLKRLAGGSRRRRREADLV
jgi:rod shape-determining protein MreD